MFRISFTVLLISGIVSLCPAQDSVKKKAPASAASPKSYSTHKTHKYHYKSDSTAMKAAALQMRPGLKDTASANAVLTDKSLNGQYQYLLTKVYYHQQPLISALWKNASDTLNASRNKLKIAQSKLAMQNNTIDSLNAIVKGDGQGGASSNTGTEGVDVFGISLSKTAYNLIVWGLVALFAVTTFVVIARSGIHRREARYRTQLYGELEEEFKTYKKQANEKEKKLARELQTERNKVDELTGKK
jgi:hypothetical protein